MRVSLLRRPTENNSQNGGLWFPFETAKGKKWVPSKQDRPKCVFLAWNNDFGGGGAPLRAIKWLWVENGYPLLEPWQVEPTTKTCDPQPWLKEIYQNDSLDGTKD